MRPRGRSSATRGADRSWRTIWQKTFCSRTRRAMSWPYCAPKSKTRTSSLSGGDTILLLWFEGCRFRPCPQGEQLFKDRFVVDVAVAPIALDIDVAVREELDLP